jgi:hypothetical protein
MTGIKNKLLDENKENILTSNVAASNMVVAVVVVTFTKRCPKKDTV